MTSFHLDPYVYHERWDRPVFTERDHPLQHVHSVVQSPEGQYVFITILTPSRSPTWSQRPPLPSLRPPTIPTPSSSWIVG